MSFAADVASALGDEAAVDEIEQILATAAISASEATPVPRRLRVDKLVFCGVKPRLLATSSEAADMDDGTASSDPVASTDLFLAGGDDVMPDAREGVAADGEPFEFCWDLGAGLYGLGSYENFRGKSSVLEIILWALRGRCGLQRDVRLWLRRVELRFRVEDEPLTVEFDVIEGAPKGRVLRRGNPPVELVAFDAENEFEAAMEAVLMPRLGLTPIPAWQTIAKDEGKAVRHTWMTYAGALFVADASLENLLGDTSFSGLPSRLLQMFVGTPSASTMVEAQVAAKAARAELAAAERRAQRDRQARASDQEQLAHQLEQAQRGFAELPDVTAQMASLAGSVDEVATRVQSVNRLRRQLGEARDTASAVHFELTAAEARRLDLVEDALARRFFNAVTPTACPRCSAPVTSERLMREREAHDCSLCASDLDLQAYAEDVLVSAAAPAHVREDVRVGAALAAEDADRQEGYEQLDELQALRDALDDAEQQVRQLSEQLRIEQQLLTQVEQLASTFGSAQRMIAERHAAELEIARLQGALEQADRAAGRTDDSPQQTLVRRVAIFEAAEKVARHRVQMTQTDLLAVVSREVLRLGQAFGIEALEKVILKGNATLEVHKGGQRTTYSACTRGEKLRLKVATAVALLRVGFTTGVGRHPGLLLVDSPGAEEATQENLDTMLEALRDMTEEIPHLQVLVATRSPELLEQLLEPERRRIAPPGSYLW